MDLVIERFRRQDAIPLPCKRSWRTIVDVLCDAFEAVEKMDLVIILSREAQSFRACGKDVCGQSSTIITSDRLSSPTPPFVVLSSQRLHPSRDLPGHDSVPRLKDGLGKANHNADQILKPCFLRIVRRRSEAGEEQRPVWASGIHWTEGKETFMPS
jgi:hypothetical protein